MQKTIHTWAINLITVAGFSLSVPCFIWFGRTGEIPLLLLGLVTFGMSYDFLSHVLGHYLPQKDNFLRWYSKINFSALCFGIPFTAFAGTFVIAEVNPTGLSAVLADNYLWILHGSVLFGLLFMFARYKKIDVNGAVEFTLDKTHGYTKFIFVTRRILLAASLVIAIIVVVDGWATNWLLWTLLFGGVFLASVPLHILHKQIPSMFSELITQYLAVYASWQVFVVG
ncbi:MAG: hypothetical protein ACR2QG_12630 [Gammaproteobacteria bacterium]